MLAQKLRLPGPKARETTTSGSLELAGGRFAAALVALQFKANLLAFLERAQGRAFNGRSVNEHVRAAVVRLDETEALGGIKPFHCAGSHKKHL